MKQSCSSVQSSRATQSKFSLDFHHVYHVLSTKSLKMIWKLLVNLCLAWLQNYYRAEFLTDINLKSNSWFFYHILNSLNFRLTWYNSRSDWVIFGRSWTVWFEEAKRKQPEKEKSDFGKSFSSVREDKNVQAFVTEALRFSVKVTGRDLKVYQFDHQWIGLFLM